MFQERSQIQTFSVTSHTSFMNILRTAIPKPLANARYPSPKTLNVYKKIVRDPSNNGELRELGWEDPSVRIGNTVTWLLRNAKKQGLAARNDGYVRVQDLVGKFYHRLLVYILRLMAQLQHPRLVNLDFTAVERAVHSFHSHPLKLLHAPRNIQ